VDCPFSSKGKGQLNRGHGLWMGGCFTGHHSLLRITRHARQSATCPAPEVDLNEACQVQGGKDSVPGTTHLRTEYEASSGTSPIDPPRQWEGDDGIQRSDLRRRMCRPSHRQAHVSVVIGTGMSHLQYTAMLAVPHCPHPTPAGGPMVGPYPVASSVRDT
jgi:hypothetical protein